MEPTTAIQPIPTRPANVVVVQAVTAREATQAFRDAFPLFSRRNITVSRTGNSTFEVWA